MTIMSDAWIIEQTKLQKLIQPFTEDSINKLEDGRHITSYGLSSYGYDIRLGNSFVLFNKTTESLNNNRFIIRKEHGTYPIPVSYVYVGSDTKKEENFIDPVDFDKRLVERFDNVDTIIIPPGGFCLGVSKELITMPRYISAICMEKSTLARTGLKVTITPLEAEWKGYITLEILNHSPMPIKLTAGMGICQVQFFKGDRPCKVSYSDRGGKYQGQAATPVLPKSFHTKD
jgi:dCTP deaminase